MSIARRLILAAIVLATLGCNPTQAPTRPPVHARGNWKEAIGLIRRSVPPPPPPPPPTDPESIGPANPPVRISAFVRGLDPRTGPPEVSLFKFGPGTGAQEFAGQHVTKSIHLPPTVASQTLVYLSSPFAYTASDPLCTDEGFGLRVESGGKSLNLIIGLLCRHVHSAESGDEIGILSQEGEAFFVKLFREQFGAT